MLSDAVTRENVMYNWLCVNAGVRRSNATCPTDWPWEWFIVIANASWTRNCLHLRWMVKSIPWMDGDSMILGMNAICPSWSPPNRQTWRTWFDICMTVALVPLHSPCLLSRLHSSIIGHPVFSSMLASGRPEAFRELRNSTGTTFGECCIPGSSTCVTAKTATH